LFERLLVEHASKPHGESVITKPRSDGVYKAI